MWNSKCLRVGVWCRCTLNLGIQINHIKEPIQSSSVGSWHVSHRGTSTFDNHLNHCIIVLKHSTGTGMRCIWWNVQCLMGWRWCAWLGWSYACLAWRRVSPWLSLGSIWSVWYGMKYFNHQIPESESGNTVHAENCIERNDLSFCRTVWNWSLFLAPPTYWHQRVTSENAQYSSRSGFWIFKISGSRFAVLRSFFSLAFSQCWSVSLRSFLSLCTERTLDGTSALTASCTALMLSAQLDTSLKRKESSIAEIHLSWLRSRRDGLEDSQVGIRARVAGWWSLALRPGRL